MKRQNRITPKEAPPTLAPLPKLKKLSVPLRSFGKAEGFLLSPTTTSDAPRLRGLRFVKAWEINNSVQVVERFAEVSAVLGNERVLYHGTAQDNITAIAEEGLRRGGSHCMFGAGIYLGEIEKASAYGRDPHHTFIIQVRAVLGNVLVADEAAKYKAAQLQKQGYDSVMGKAGHTKSWGGTLALSEWVLYSPEQVLAERIFAYESLYDRTVLKPQPTGYSCGAIRERTNVPMKGMSAFKDLLTQQPCNRMAYNRLQTDRGFVWVCASCIRELNLRVGTKIDIKDPNPRQTGIVKAKITCGGD